MATIDRFRIEWSGGGVVGPGLSTLYFDTPVAGVVADVTSFFTEVLKYCPPSVSVLVPNSGDQIDSASGDIVGTWTSGAATSIPGSSANGSFAAGVGARVVWNTSGRRNNRRVRGSTFIVPLDSGRYDTFGTLASSVVTDLKFRGDTLITAQSNSLVIWSRPKDGEPGFVNSATSTTCPDKVTWLRSRRT